MSSAPGDGRPAAVGPARCIDDETPSVEDLYERHFRRLCGLAAAIALDRFVAQDIVHDAFAGLSGRIGEVRNPEAYLQRSVVNRAVQIVQRRQRERTTPRQPVRHHPSPEIDETWEIVTELPVRQRAVVVLRFWEDLSYEQIAAVLAMPLGTVQSTLHRALLALKERLQ